MTTYIVIEVPENENALDVLNLLMTQTKARFTITKEIWKYAAEKEQLNRINFPANGGDTPSPQKSTVRERKEDTPRSNDPPPKKVRIDPVEPRKVEPVQVVTLSVTPKKKPSPTPIEHLNIVPKVEEPDIMEQLMESTINNYWEQQPEPEAQKEYSSLADMFANASSTQNESTNGRARRQNDSFQCHMCGAMIKAYNLDYYKRSNHAIIHTSLQRYICPVNGCGTKTRHRSNMVVHARTVHGLKGKVEVPNCLMPHEEDELKRTVVNCFPEMRETVENLAKKEKRPNLFDFTEENGGGIDSDEEMCP